MAHPATIVETGGVPVLPVDEKAPALTVVESGGFPITISDNGTPFILEGYVPPVE